ncbi:MAG: VWA domain-containing protein [Planctomycetota bacterium]|nr:VWA domain-containing protein [Planctomycetota bacterium]
MKTSATVVLATLLLAGLVFLPSCGGGDYPPPVKPDLATAPPEASPPASQPAAPPAVAQPAGPPTTFFGSGSRADHVCYVIDRSGSMIDTFQFVRQEMLISISRLRPSQDFHVLLFAEANPKELMHRRLVPASDRYKQDVADFLDSIRAEGKTDPIPALLRAFDVLAKADASKPGKVIYLLTDGVFPDSQAVLQAIRARNADKGVIIHTFLYGNKPPEAEKVMKDIAAENGGKYKFVSADE